GITVTTSELGPRIVAIELEVPQRALAGVERREFERRMRAVGGAFVAVVEGSRARVRFELPTERAEAEPASETPDPPPAVPVPVADRGSIDRVRILLVDDYDLVRGDLMMPGKSGMEVYHSVVAQRPELAERFVFISGGASTPEAERFL